MTLIVIIHEEGNKWFNGTLKYKRSNRGMKNKYKWKKKAIQNFFAIDHQK